MEIILVLVIALIIFGPKRLPGLGKQLGGGLREFKESLTGDHGDDDEDEPKPALAAAREEPVRPDVPVHADDVPVHADVPARPDVKAANEAVGRPAGD